jgi:hypothetical protein
MFHYDLQHTGNLSEMKVEIEGQFYVIPSKKGGAAVIYLD